MPYLFALGTEGHEYYLAPEELLSVAEAIHANVVITRESATHFEVDSYTVGWPGEIAVLVLRGAQRGHFERLVPASIYEKAKLLRIEEKKRQYEVSCMLRAESESKVYDEILKRQIELEHMRRAEAETKRANIETKKKITESQKLKETEEALVCEVCIPDADDTLEREPLQKKPRCEPSMQVR